MLPEFFAAIFREFVRRTFAEGRVGKKSSFSLDFPVLGLIAYCFRYYFALTSLLIVLFSPRKLHVVFSVFWRYPAFRFLTFCRRLCFTWRVVQFCCWKIFRSLGLPVFFSVLGTP